MNHIALIGPKHSGKTTLATMLEERYFDAVRVGLADEVKNETLYLLNEFIETNIRSLPDRWDGAFGKEIPLLIDRQELEDAKDEVFLAILQWFGTDFVRGYLKAPTYWIDRYREVVEADRGRSMIICDDVRFPNEAEALKEMGFTLIRLIRPEEDRIASIRESGGDLERLAHPSETEHQRITHDEQYLVESLDDLAAVAADIGTRWCVDAA